ncbi:MAG: SPOR domain-containing protein [Smithella sp.]
MASGNTKNFELKLGRTGLTIVIVGITALLCGIFLFGVAVGKNIDTYPENIASVPQKLLALVWRPAKIKIAQKVEENKVVQNQTKAQEEPDLTFFNTLTGKKGVAKEQPIPDKKPVVEVPVSQPLVSHPQGAAATSINSGTELKKPMATNATTGDKKEVKRKEAKSATTNKIVEDEIEAKIKEAEPVKAAKIEKFAIQVASLKEKAKATELQKKLSASGFNPRIVENNIPGKGKWFRVVIEGFSSKTSAQAAVEKITKKTGINSGIVKRIDTAAKNN